ncbi:MAG: hypothetical protein H3Z54_14155 [archaeon]|nr:hypothetical protein [archaeon]
MKRLENKTILATIGLVASAFTLFIKLMLPVTIQIIIQGESIEIRQIPNIYFITDVAIIGVSCFVLGASLLYLLLPYQVISVPTNTHITQGEVRPIVAMENWRKVLEELTDEDERKVYQLIMDENGVIFQGRLVEKSGFPKSKISLVLDRLEARDLIERKRRGMSNIVVLK